VFGLPIDHVHVDSRGLLVLPFERFRIDFDDNLPDPYFFQLGIMGEERLLQLGRVWHNEPKADAKPGCQFFAETGHNLCEPFLTYWKTHGLNFDYVNGSNGRILYEESLALFGFPISEASPEVGSDGVTRLTQWFQRARLEEHPQNTPPYNILLGLLNAEVLNTPAAAPAPAPVPAPAPQPPAAPAPQCDPSYPTVCIPPPPPDLDCGDIPYRDFQVVGSDPHRFDRDRDGIGCES
jgi:hypothetical protein